MPSASRVLDGSYPDRAVSGGPRPEEREPWSTHPVRGPPARTRRVVTADPTPGLGVSAARSGASVSRPPSQPSTSRSPSMSSFCARSSRVATLEESSGSRSSSAPSRSRPRCGTDLTSCPRRRIATAKPDRSRPRNRQPRNRQPRNRQPRRPRTSRPGCLGRPGRLRLVEQASRCRCSAPSWSAARRVL